MQQAGCKAQFPGSQHPTLRARVAPVPQRQQQQLQHCAQVHSLSGRGRGNLQRAMAVEGTLTLENEVATTSPNVEMLSTEGGEYRLRGELAMPGASGRLVYDVLTDYESLGAIFENVTESRVEQRHPELLVWQACRWEFLVFSGSFGLLLRVGQDDDNMHLQFDLVESSFMRAFVGTWTVEPLPGGWCEGCIVRHEQAVRPLMVPPQLIGGYTSKIFVRQVSRILEDLRDEVARRQAAAAGVAQPVAVAAAEASDWE